MQSKTPSGDVWLALNGERRLPWLAAMRLELVVRKSSQLWRRTDDAHSTCVLRPVDCAAEVLFCGHYVLWQCTDETSVDKATVRDARRLLW